MTPRRAASADELTAFGRAVMFTVSRVPSGRVASYADIAERIGRPRAARGVGSALQALPDSAAVPWWRIINSRGAISPGGGLHRARLQRELLEREGVRFDSAGRTDFAVFGWRQRRREVD